MEYARLDMLWERYPRYHEMTCFTTLDQLLQDHESYTKDFDDKLRQEYEENHYQKFLIQLSWSDLPYRYQTRKLIESAGTLAENAYVSEFLSQFSAFGFSA